MMSHKMADWKLQDPITPLKQFYWQKKKINLRMNYIRTLEFNQTIIHECAR